ncbi:MAG: hypothetical protein EOO49_16010 [Flavobacterium sp.]|nr:MAG: hypothetical protein EOO49_16010 [Flavobacterium sp.]
MQKQKRHPKTILPTGFHRNTFPQPFPTTISGAVCLPLPLPLQLPLPLPLQLQLQLPLPLL